jgi:predicted tellurium resistance membrane protein TerC
MFEWIYDFNGWAALLTLTLLEIVLGIDNIVFISILAGKLPESKRNTARAAGLGLAMFTRILLVFSIALLMKLTHPLFSLMDKAITGKDIILLAGGLFLIAKSTFEIHGALEGEEHERSAGATATMASVLVQIALLDIVFSLDSVITAVGMVQYVSVMVLAIVISVGIMMLAANPVSVFIEKHPTIKMLALSFLILIGVTLVGEGLHFHIPKGYIYFAMAFSTLIEMLNMKVRARSSKPVSLKKPI